MVDYGYVWDNKEDKFVKTNVNTGEAVNSNVDIDESAAPNDYEHLDNKAIEIRESIGLPIADEDTSYVDSTRDFIDANEELLESIRNGEATDEVEEVTDELGVEEEPQEEGLGEMNYIDKVQQMLEMNELLLKIEEGSSLEKVEALQELLDTENDKIFDGSRVELNDEGNLLTTAEGFQIDAESGKVLGKDGEELFDLQEALGEADDGLVVLEDGTQIMLDQDGSMMVKYGDAIYNVEDDKFEEATLDDWGDKLDELGMSDKDGDGDIESKILTYSTEAYEGEGALLELNKEDSTWFDPNNPDSGEEFDVGMEVNVGLLRNGFGEYVDMMMELLNIDLHHPSHYLDEEENNQFRTNRGGAASTGGSSGGGGSTGGASNAPTTPITRESSGSEGETINGTAGNDNLNGSAGDDTITGNQGDDVITANQGNDLVHGGQGNDIIHGGQGDDEIRGDKGNDQAYGDKGNDGVYGGEGDDIVQGNQGNDFVQGNQGNDFVYGGKGDDTLHGGQGNDILSGDFGRDVLNGDKGNDVMLVGQGDVAYGGEGHDIAIVNGGTADAEVVLDMANMSNDEIKAELQANGVNVDSKLDERLNFLRNNPQA